MSHFAMLVVGDNVEDKLQPFHEFECTGTDDEYVKDMEITHEAEETLEESTVRRYKDPDGNLHDPYDEKFYRQPTEEEEEKIGIGGTGSVGDISFSSREWSNGEYEPRIHFKPEGWEEVEIPNPRSLKEFADYYYGIDTFVTEEELEEYGITDDMKYGYGVVDEDGNVKALYERTNPNAKWDWYQIGGRYRDRLKLKENADGEKGKRQEQFVGSLYRESTDGYCDIARKGDIDWDEIHQNEEDYEKAIRFWEMKVEGDEPKTEDEKERMEHSFYKPEYFEDRYGDKETFAQCRSNFTMWGILTDDGEWIEKGDMGWWGMSDESHSDAVQWEMNFFDKFIEPLDDDTKLTVVDCHI